MSADSPVKIVVISGSLRAASKNTGLARAVVANAPEGVEAELLDISEFPLYNYDIEASTGFPDAVKAVRDAIAAADGIVFATPEYNYSISGVLKNAIDWISRGTADDPQPFAGKAGGMVSAAGGIKGTRAQYHLRQVAVFLKLNMVTFEATSNGFAGGFDDATGDVTDDEIKDRAVELTAEVAKLARQLKA